MATCPAESELDAVLNNSLAGSRRHLVEQHIETCEHCQQTLEHLTSDTEIALAIEQRDSSSPLDPQFVQRVVQKLNEVSARESAPPAIKGYQVQQVIGRGGMGVVYRAHHQRLRRDVAIKVIGRKLEPNDHRRDLFQTEGEILAKLVHPNIAQVYDAGESGGMPYLVMELVDGGSLREFRDRALPVHEAVELVATLADAIDVTHRHGVIHRDLKPANILFSASDELDTASVPGSVKLDGRIVVPRISDFGLALRAAEATESRGFQGTPSYMAPEQLTQSGDAVGPAADIHALGLMLYELLTGQHPFRSDSIEWTFWRIREDVAPPPVTIEPSIPLAVDTAVMKALAKEPEQRFETAAEFANELRRAIVPVDAAGAWRLPAAAITAVLLVFTLTWTASRTIPSTDASIAPVSGSASLQTEPDSLQTRATPAGVDQLLQVVLDDRGVVVLHDDPHSYRTVESLPNPLSPSRVRSIVVARGKRLPAELAVHLAELTQLERFVAPHTGVNDADLLHLSSITTLVDLDLFESSISSAGMQHFADHPGLSHLAVGLTEVELNKLPLIESLERLTVSGGQLTAGTSERLKTFPSLRSIAVFFCTNEALGELAQVDRLQSVALWVHEFRHPIIATLAKMPNLQSLELGRFPLSPEDLGSIDQLKSLTELRLIGVRAPVRQQLQVGPALRRVVLRQGRYDRSGWQLWTEKHPSVEVVFDTK